MNAGMLISQTTLLAAPVVMAAMLTFRSKCATLHIPSLEDLRMRGLQRLATVTQSVLKDMDDQAGAVADELTAAQAESQTVITGFQSFVGEIKANTARVRDVLNQLTNGAPPGPLPDTAASPPSPAVPT